MTSLFDTYLCIGAVSAQGESIKQNLNGRLSKVYFGLGTVFRQGRDKYKSVLDQNKFKDRQQEVMAVLVAPPYIGD